MKKKSILLGVLVLCVVLLSICYVSLNRRTKKDEIPQQEITESGKQETGDATHETGDVTQETEDSNSKIEDFKQETEGNGQNDMPETGQEKDEFVNHIKGEAQAWDSYNQIRNAIVKIDMGDFSGSGVIYEITEDKIVIASSGHLLSNYESGVVTFSNGGIGVGWVDGISETYDAGFMSVDLSDLEEDKRDTLLSANIDLEAYENLQDEDEIFQVGSTSGVAADFYMGTVSAKEWYVEEFGTYMLYNFCKATPGMSGGGTFTLSGDLIGLVSGSYMEESCALPLPAILSVYQEVYATE